MMSDLIEVNDLNCIVCGEPVGNGAVITAATMFGTIGFCDSCWSFIFNAVYEDLKASGQINQDALD